MTRRRFVRHLGQGVSGAALCAMPLSIPGGSPRKRRVAVMADLHIGRRSDHRDGGEWLARGLEDIKRNLQPIHYGLTLGDITHRGDRKSLERYLALRDDSRIPRWYELAGNHEFKGNGMQHYQELVRDHSPYSVRDGNILWLFLSDEHPQVAGSITPDSLRWIEETVRLNEDKIIILCSHQPPPDTVRRSDEDRFCLHPKDKMKDLLTRLPIPLSLCGHEHHHPASAGNISRQYGTTVVNVASMTHSYGTASSESVVIELEEGSREALVRRRCHDKAGFRRSFELRVPLGKRVRLASDVCPG